MSPLVDNRYDSIHPQGKYEGHHGLYQRVEAQRWLVREQLAPNDTAGVRDCLVLALK
ncbi:MAG TPA: hypothetical protein VGQ39_25825 [Pyrinomonadaceae bacterium]|nr:hypothetical protein [Pyrinomonadaceae bacterium]